MMGESEAIVKAYAYEVGFDLVGITSADEFERGKSAEHRVRLGLMDGLPWFTAERVWRASRPNVLLPGARSVIALGMSYNMMDRLNHDHASLSGNVAKYAWGRDYHVVIKERLRTFVNGISLQLGVDVRTRSFVDDGPMLDRAAAERAGIGWYGKNTNILTSTHGSWVFLAQVITDLELKADAPLHKSCGSCRLCIDACPTEAIIEPYVLDNHRCIAYQTIENRGPTPRDMRPLIGDWVFGCDICQDVCPVNIDVAKATEPAFTYEGKQRVFLELTSMLEMTENEYHERFRGSSIKRATMVGLQRNACVAMGNVGNASNVPTLALVLLDNGAPLVRSHAAWALGRIGGPEAWQALGDALVEEADFDVRKEIEMAKQEIENNSVA